MGIAVAVCLAPRAGAAAERAPRVAVTWTAPRDCPGTAEVARRIEAQLPDHDTPDTAHGALHVTGQVRREGARFHLALAIEGRGERELVADACDALTSTAAVIVAMSGREEAPPKESPSPPSSPSSPSPAAATESAPGLASPALAEPPARDATPRSLPAPRTRLLLRAEAVVDGGLLPAAAPGGGIAVGAARGPLRVEVAGALHGSQSMAAGEPGKGASFTLVTAALRGCLAFGRSVEIGPCVGAGAARIGGHGEGVQKDAVGASMLAGPEAAVTLGVPLAATLTLRAGVSAFLPVARQAFVITGLGTVHTPAVVALNAFVGPEVRF